MSNKILNLVFKADTTNAQQGIDSLTGTEGGATGIFGLSGALGGLINPASLSIGALVALGDTMKNEIDNYNDYVTEVDNLGLSLSLTTEDASFLMAAMERYGISNDTMVAVFRKLSSEGIDPTIENLKVLLEQWEAMPEGAEKGQFAMEMFGEQGIKQILPWWEKLNDEQRENFGLQEDGLVVTDEMTAASWEYQQQVADLSDEWGAFKVQILTEIIPALSDLLSWLNKGIDGGADLKTRMNELIEGGYTGGQQAAGVQAGMDITTPDYRDSDMYPGHATGGRFTVGGSGGSDTTPVGFLATPGETVSIGGGTNDNQQILAEIRRLVNTLPTMLTDALERS